MSKSSGQQKEQAEQPLDHYYLRASPEEMILTYDKGDKIGEPCRISDLDKIYCYMPGFLTGTTGQPNHGKTLVKLFMMLVKSIVDGKKWVIDSPEMIVSTRRNGKIQRSPIYLIKLLIHAYTGKNPYKHKGIQLPMEEYMAAYEFIEQHFYFIDTGKDRHYKTILKVFRRFYDAYGIYGWLIDPWKNIDYEETGSTKDRVLQKVLDEFKYFAMETDTCGDFILHPKNMKERELRKNGTLKGQYKVITQHDLLGGSVWDNSLDSIYSYYRQEIHDDPNSPLGSLYLLKQKMQDLTTQKGEYDQIYYDKNKNRFYFNGVCPIDGSRREPLQTAMSFKKPYEKDKSKVKENANGYPEHWDSNTKENFPF